MPITVKHSGNAAPFAAGAFAGSAKRGIPQMAIPAWGAGERLSRRKRGMQTMEAPAQVGTSRVVPMAAEQVSTVATRAGFQGPTPVGVSNPNTVAAKAGFSRRVNLGGTVNLTPQEVSKQVAARRTGRIDKGENDLAYDAEMRKRDAVEKLEAERMDQKEYDYKQRMDRKEFDYKRQFEAPAKSTVGQAEDPYDYDFTDQQRQRFDQLNQAADEVRNSGEFKSGSPEQMDALSQIEKLQDEIRPTRRLKEKKQDPLALAQSKIFTDPVSGNRGFIKANGGDLEFIKQEPDPAVQQAEKQKESFVSLYEKIATEPFKETKMVDIGGKPQEKIIERPKTDEEIKSEVARAIKIKQDAEAYLNPDASAPPGKVVAPNGDTTYEGEAGLAIQKTERLFKKLRGMDQGMISPEAKAVLGLGEDSFYAAAQEKANARGISVNDYISQSS